MTARDRLAIMETISAYFLALDGGEEIESLLQHYTEDAVWECFNAGDRDPFLRFDSAEEIRTNTPMMSELQAAGLRHHLTGVIFLRLSREEAKTLIKVLVTQQPNRKEPPVIRNTATVVGGWRKEGEGWKISSWRINRDSSS